MRHIAICTLLSVLPLKSLCLAQEGEDPGKKDPGAPHLVADAAKLKRTVVVPMMDAEIGKDRNVLWCVTFQLAWKELEIVAGGTMAVEPMGELAKALIKSEVEEGVLDEPSYVARAGRGIEEAIRKEIEEKFKGTVKPELLDGETVAYALLYKHLPFEWAFHRFDDPHIQFGKQAVENFGINQYDDEDKAEKKMAGQVRIMDYAGENDFVIELKLADPKDRMILAKVPPAKTLNETVRMVMKRVDEGKPSAIKESENLFIPVIDFKVTRDFPEFEGAKILCKNPDLNGAGLQGARQITRFRLDEKGAVIKSESAYWLSAGHRSFYFNKPFLVLLMRRTAAQPYFALWIANEEMLIPLEKREKKK